MTSTACCYAGTPGGCSSYYVLQRTDREALSGFNASLVIAGEAMFDWIEICLAAATATFFVRRRATGLTVAGFWPRCHKRIG